MTFTLPLFLAILMIEIDQSVNFFANIKALWTKNVGLFSWAIMDDKGGLVASECVKLCSRVWGHGAC